MRRRPVVSAGFIGGLASGITALLVAWPAFAATTSPQLKLSAANAVPACFTAAGLMQHVGRANPNLDPKFRDIAAVYESQGAKLGLRWDYAFFQMLVETSNLSFTGKTNGGELTKELNNFASIRSASSEEPDKFPDVTTGVLAHLHHIRLYSGDPVDKPAAKRTKQVEHFILSWSRQLKRPVRFDDMIGRWSPNNPGYGAAIEAAMQDFRAAHCKGSDQVASNEDQEPPRKEARKAAKSTDDMRGEAAAGPASARPAPAPAMAIVGEPIRTANVAPSKTSQAKPVQPVSSAQSAFAPPAQEPEAAAMPAKPAASTASATVANAAVAAAPSAQCKVWSASFGGDKSVLIRVNDGQVTHFTALQVNAGREKEETTAYIAAYARGGSSMGDFSTADQAINKAFELCPKT